MSAASVVAFNNLRNIEISLERNRADNERNINEINWQLKRISPKESRDQKLVLIGFIAAANAQDSQDEATYWRNRMEIIRRSQETDSQLQAAPVAQLRTATYQLQANLGIARANLDSLTVASVVDDIRFRSAREESKPTYYSRYSTGHYTMSIRFQGVAPQEMVQRVGTL